MGSFYVNACISELPEAQLSRWLGNLDTPSFVGSRINGWTCFVNEMLEMQDQDFIDLLGKHLTRDSTRKMVSVLNHDSSILSVDTFANGARTGSYNSCPGYFHDKPAEADLKPRLKNVDAFRLLVPGLTVERVQSVFYGDGSFRLAEQIHGAVVDLLGLPAYSIGMGFTYVSQGESDAEWIAVEPNSPS